MTENALKETVIRLAEPVVRSLGLVIWGVEILQAGRMIVRLFVDVPPSSLILKARPDGSGTQLEAISSDPASAAPASSTSPSIDQCEEISRHWRWPWKWRTASPTHMCWKSPPPGSRGLFSALRKCGRIWGTWWKPVCMRPLLLKTLRRPPARDAGRKVWRGRLAAVEEDGFVLEPALVSPEGDAKPEGLPPLCLPWQTVRKASRLHIFHRPGKPGKSSGKKTGKAAGKASGKNVAETENTAD